MSMPEDKAIESQLRECVSDAVPHEVEVRLRARLAEFRSRLNARETVAATPVRRLRLTTGWKLGLTCAAAGLVVAALGLVLWPRASFADVAAAVLQQSWIRVRPAGNGGDESELWYAPGRNIVATRRPDRTTYRDYRLQVVDLYEAKDKVVYHAPLAPGQFGDRDVGTMVEAVAALLQAERLPENPLARLDLLGAKRTTMRVLDQRIEKATEAGHNWLDYRLTVADPSFEQPLRIRVRADAATKLPALCRFDWQHGGKPATLETRIDYPERGPADLYDLGVPRTARHVDRVPAGDLKRIMETIQAGRERMDDYRAVFVDHGYLADKRWWTAVPIVVYRKGKNFRVDYPSSWSGLSATKRPDPGEDLGKWWHKRTEFFHPFPAYVVRDTTEFTSDVKRNTRPDGTQDAEIVSVSSREKRELIPPLNPTTWSMCPEFVCRPPMGLGNAFREPVLELHPPDGPPGCVRLSIRWSGSPDENRYWLDPKRDFIVVRMDWVTRDAAGREKVTQRTTAEETARSPQGVWYATKIRRSSPDAVGNQKFDDQVAEFYVDFDVKLPDSIFEPPKPGKIR
jgi:hypothetical protein